MDIPAAHPDPVRRSLEVWHDMIDKLGAPDFDASQLREISHQAVVFRSPVAHTPYPGQDALYVALSAVAEVFKDFQYTRVFATDDGMSAVLEFTALVNDKQVTGIDALRFDEAGLITEMLVMIRPLSGLNELAAEMAPRIGAKLKELGVG